MSQLRASHTSTFWLNVKHFLWDTLGGVSLSVTFTRKRLRLSKQVQE